eukprot:SAG22_NODE_3_length_48349_cov_158.681180_39_plen_301_part_00
MLFVVGVVVWLAPLSTEFMLDCDSNDNGCSGGMLGDAWKFLTASGLPTEACYPYKHYPGPPPPPPPPVCTTQNNTNLNYKPLAGAIRVIMIGIDSPNECCAHCGETAGCVLGVFQPPGLCHLKAAKDIAGGAVAMPGYVAGKLAPAPAHSHPKPVCPTVCKDGGPITLYKTKTADAVGPPGNVAAMQRELMAHGPFEVGFEVFSDFSSYKNGTYSRIAGAHLGGGHAVKLIGWGLGDDSGEYWLIANSWTANWGTTGCSRSGAARTRLASRYRINSGGGSTSVNIRIYNHSHDIACVRVR